MDEHKSRAQTAAATRERVLEQARGCFLTQGYAATSTRQIAAAAGVTERTLFNIVATKSELLRQVVLLDIFGRHQAPLREHTDFAAKANAAATAEEFLREFTRWVLRVHGRSAPLAEMVRGAAAVDAGAAEIWRWGNAQQVTDCRHLVGLLRRRGWLPAGLTASEAADSLALLSGHETYWRLVVELQWKPQQYRRWLHRHCSLELIRSDRVGGHRPAEPIQP